MSTAFGRGFAFGMEPDSSAPSQWPTEPAAVFSLFISTTKAGTAPKNISAATLREIRMISPKLAKISKCPVNEVILFKYNDLKITDMFHSLIYNYSYYKMGIENGLRISQLIFECHGGKRK
ncbi:hypothetical protein [Brevibacillus borstelensis]|uniref:hypothetical protein n=1 Tax=Brevibacillus TaxID=55080 RepID=UPI001141AF5F|nr:hypothetical protein [Brevibacillus borstelensis]MBE5397364.1 hypothetical protein [Brevibacillus borstelensis]MCM3623156.1 hypothetical protein [Brevibacillus borstelensis]MED1872190.1 hypothetical protein [Brevibacillus borstelensis]MED1883691.1 hypothetical protein [Brevibacillus borstelensis]NOU55676.1 hypothetical protein [Brevibacillus borstelensis]